MSSPEFPNMTPSDRRLMGIPINGNPSLATPILQFNSVTFEFDWVAVQTGGESNTASNVGAGDGWFKQKTGVDLEFKSIIGELNKIAVQSNPDDLTITIGSDIVTLTDIQTLTQKTLTTPTIASLVNMLHSHLNAAGGGNITAAAISDFAVAVAAVAAVIANTAKITNANHTGDATGATVLTIAALAVTQAKLALLSVGTPQLIDLAVTETKIINEAVTLAKMKNEAGNPNLFIGYDGAGVVVAKAGSAETTLFASKIKQTDEIRNNTTVEIADDTLFFTPEANDIYLFQMFLMFDISSIADFKYLLELPSGATADKIVGNWNATNISGMTDVGVSNNVSTTGALQMISMVGRIIMSSTVDTISLLWAQQTAQVEDSKLLAGSSLIVYKQS